MVSKMAADLMLGLKFWKPTVISVSFHKPNKKNLKFKIVILILVSKISFY